MALKPGDGGAVEISPTGWVAQQAQLYEESGGTEGTTLRGAPVCSWTTSAAAAARCAAPY